MVLAEGAAAQWSVGVQGEALGPVTRRNGAPTSREGTAARSNSRSSAGNQESRDGDAGGAEEAEVGNA